MNFKDIPQFVRDGDYEVNVSLEYLETTLEDYKKAYGLELNPDFQRGHVWTEQQQIDYVEFLLRGGRTARVIYFNSPAFGKYEDETDGSLDNTIICVDGLQRITAVRRFLNNEIPVFGIYYKDFEGHLGMRQTLRFNINSLLTRKEVLEWYLQFNSGGTVHSQEELDRVRHLLEQERTND